MNINLKNNERGFTIVELLIVIVVIGILAAITIVAYNGVQNRAKTSSAQSAASNVIKKAEVYNAEETTTGYPPTLATLTASGASALPYYVTGVTPVLLTALSNSSANNAVAFQKCGVDAAGAATSAATVTNQTGVRATYRNFATSANVNIDTGVTTGTVNGFAVSCHISN